MSHSDSANYNLYIDHLEVTELLIKVLKTVFTSLSLIQIFMTLTYIRDAEKVCDNKYGQRQIKINLIDLDITRVLQNALKTNE